MKKIAVFSGGRADFYPLLPIIQAIERSEKLELHLIISGGHLSDEQGNTYKDIENQGIKIGAKIDMLVSSGELTSIPKSMALCMISLSDELKRSSPDILLLLGDRFEALVAAQTAMIMGIPVAHFSGGELTEGALDEMIRHAITKMSKLHFVATNEFYNRVKQLGENPEYIYNVGEPGLINIKNTNLFSKSEIFCQLNIPFDLLDAPLFLATFHPETAIENSAGVEPLIESLLYFKDCLIIFTYPNFDHGGKEIIEKIDAFVNNNKNAFSFKNLGSKKYFSVIKYSSLVIGNSSSAIIEVPYFKVPVVDIGNRQKGRPKAENIICCDNRKDSIVSSIKKSQTSCFLEQCKKTVNPYDAGAGCGLEKTVIEVLDNYQDSHCKKFFDYE